MVYMVCEDSGSGFTFWISIIKKFISKRAICTTSYGCDQFKGKVKKVCKEMNTGDTIVLIVDSIKGTELEDAIGVVKEVCSGKGVKIICNSCFCFESIFLTYRNLLEFLDLDTNSCEICREVYKITQYEGNDIRESLGNNAEGSYIGGVLGSVNTLEQACSRILTDVTGLSKIKAGIDKSDIGDCWITDCIRGHESKRRDEKFCRAVGCNKCKTYMSFTDKVLDIEKNSELGNGEYRLQDIKRLIEE